MPSTEKKTTDLKQGGIAASAEGLPYVTESYNGITRSPEDQEKAKEMADELAGVMVLDRTPVEILADRVTELESKLLNLTGPPPPSATAPTETIAATMVGGTFNCPECGLRITSPAMISTQGLQTGGYYEHPFDEAPRLSGKKCRLIGQKFKSPVVLLEFVKVAPPKKLDVQETIGV